MKDAKGLSEYKCTCHCGGSMFWAHLHAEGCPLSVHGEKAPESIEQSLRRERDALAERLKQCEEEIVKSRQITEHASHDVIVALTQQRDQLTADLQAARAEVELHHAANMQTMGWWEQSKQSNERLKSALVAIDQAWETKSHEEEGIDTFHFWYSANYEQIQAARQGDGCR